MSAPAEQTNDSLAKKLTDLLQQRFHLSAFRPGQLEAIEKLLVQKRLLCIQPTGHGKSLLYQLPSVLLPGMTLVISPLLALMRDQIEQLQSRFSIVAASINSDQAEDENRRVQQRAEQGEIAILFIAPEKLDSLDYRDFLVQLPISLLVIDEAHCVSTWGHDFRPSYRQIAHFATAIQRQIPDLHLLALTATANAQTAHDIAQQLSIDHKEVTVQRQSMARPNIHLSVVTLHGLAEKLIACHRLLMQLQGIGLIYCATRENTVMVADFLRAHAIQAVAYHAGLAAEKKRTLQQGFLANAYPVMVATNALGMGIDKQDLRYIIHFDLPGSMTAYYQEVGRCGRDGKAAHGILLFDESDKKIQAYFIDAAQPQLEDFTLVQRIIAQAEMPLGLLDIKRAAGMHPTRVQVVMAELLEQGLVEKKRVGRKQVYAMTQATRTIDLSRYERQRQVREHELQNLLGYAHSTDTCLMLMLRQALGDSDAALCNNCANCQPFVWDVAGEATDCQRTTRWLNQRSVTVSLGQINEGVDAVALLDGKMRSRAFIQFMTTRQQEKGIIDPYLQSLLVVQLNELQQQHALAAVITIPSKTWCDRSLFSAFISQQLAVPDWSSYLRWQTEPEARQGALLNNDQRRYNVANKMTCQMNKPVSGEAILLFDDYTGSGATLKEAIRVLRKQAGFRGTIVPLTLASVRWRLGQRGMI